MEGAHLPVSGHPGRASCTDSAVPGQRHTWHLRVCAPPHALCLPARPSRRPVPTCAARRPLPSPPLFPLTPAPPPPLPGRYVAYDEYDNALGVMITHSPLAWEHVQVGGRGRARRRRFQCSSRRCLPAVLALSCLLQGAAPLACRPRCCPGHGTSKFLVPNLD